MKLVISMAYGIWFRHFRTDTVSISAPGNIVNLQGVPEAVPDQRKRPGNLPESDTLAQNRPCEAGRSMLQEQDDVSGCRTVILQDHDALSAQRNPMPVQQSSLSVQRNLIPLVLDSLQEQLSSGSKPLFSTKMAKFHQFRHFRCSLSSNHTHGDSHITTHFSYILSRRHNADFSFTQQ